MIVQRESVMTRDVHQGMWVICGCSLNLSSMWSALFTESQPFDRIGKYYWIRLVRYLRFMENVIISLKTVVEIQKVMRCPTKEYVFPETVIGSPDCVSC